MAWCINTWTLRPTPTEASLVTTLIWATPRDLTALWARSLAEFAELAEATGNPGGSRWARDLHAAAAIGYEDLWDAEPCVYVDHIIDGARRPAASQAAGAAAILSGLAPRERWTPIVEAITDSERLVVRSWIGSET